MPFLSPKAGVRAVILVVSQQAAVQLSTVAVFEAANPWSGGSPGQWTLSVYRVVSGTDHKLFRQYAADRQRETVDGQNLDADDTLGIRAAGERYHLLPRAMVRLWQEGRVPTEALPRLVAAMETKLRPGGYAYFSPMAGRRWLRVFGWLCALGGVCFVVAGLFNNFVRHVEDSALVGGLITCGVVFLLCGVPFLLIGRPGRGVSKQQTRQILAML